MEKLLGSLLIKRTAIMLIAVMALFSFVPRVEAGFAPAQVLKTQGIDRGQDLATVQNVLENKMVGERLASLGYTPQEIDAKLAKLSDGEMHNLAMQLDSLAPGGELGLVIGILLIILLVVVIMKLV